MRAVKLLNLSPILLTVVAALWLMLTGCGSAVDPAGELTVSLQVQTERDLPTFWFNLDRRELTVEGRGETRTIAWVPGQEAAIKAEAGDKITFSAYDPSGQRGAGGEAIVGKEKRVVIPVREVL